MKLLRQGIYLIIFCLPLYLVRFEIFSIPTTVLELLIYILFISWFITSLQSKKLQSTTYNLWIIPIFLILMGISLATIFSFDLRVSAGIWKTWFIDPVLFFIVLISVIKTNKQIKRIFYSLFLSGTIVSIVALIYLILGKLDSLGRLQAFYDSPNYLAMYLAPALIISAGYCLFTFLASSGEARSGTGPRSFAKNETNILFSLTTSKKAIASAFILLSTACLLLAIVFTKSFGVWLGIIAALGISLFIWLFKIKRKLAWIILFVAVIGIAILGCFAIQHRASSLGARLIIWEKAIQIYKNNPILGIGPGTFRNYFPPYPEWGVPHPHNIFLAFLLQTGIIGFIGFIWLIILFFKTTIKKLFACKDSEAWRMWSVASLMAIMIYFLVHGLVDTTYWKNDLSVMFWLVIGLVTILKMQEYKK